MRLIFFARLDITVLYTIFLGFKKLQASTQSPKGLDVGFTEKRLFTPKTRQKFVLHLYEARILSLLDISVVYINF
jgi:hypothetical protein